MSEASQYQTIRRHWKQQYTMAQRRQSLHMQVVLTGTVKWGINNEPTPATLAQREEAIRCAIRYQSQASEYMQLLNRFVVREPQP